MQHVQEMEADCSDQIITWLAEETFEVHLLVLVGVNALNIEDNESKRST